MDNTEQIEQLKTKILDEKDIIKQKTLKEILMGLRDGSLIILEHKKYSEEGKNE